MRELEGSDAWGLDHVDVERLNRLAADALTMEYTQKHWKPEERIEVAEDLPLTDCYVAPCVTACAIKQDIPEYIRLLGEHRYADALELIYQRNALPAITGHICESPVPIQLYPPGLRQCAEYPRTEKSRPGKRLG
ncbi:pyridine nucleotide-disulfide oxidoreductase [Escherichia coli]|uniref:Pyridine nucleotide-disulfide oxidoreductase n=1 Tax=Escherichia coli TaxID=562 RepID=A0A484YUI1_ECOLX|nr:pyridine nucleotide-disulfide oxidoreductase [Escherichia coli]